MTQLSREKLLPLVEAAALDREWLQDIHHRLKLQQDHRDQLPVSFQRLLAYIDAVAELDIFRDGFYMLAGGGATVHRDVLVTFFVRRASESSAAAAVDDLLRYMAADTIPCVRRTLICGARAQDPFQLDEHTRFIPWGQIADDGDVVIQQEGDRLLASNSFSLPSGILEKSFRLLKQHVLAAAERPKSQSPVDLLDARGPVMALALTCPNAVFGPSTWLHYPAWVICAPRGTRYFQPLPERTGQYQLKQEDISAVQDLSGRIFRSEPRQN